MKKPTETELVKACIKWLKLSGIYVWRNNTGGRPWTDAKGKSRLMTFGLKGSADIIGVMPPRGRALFVECKTKGGKQSIDQQLFESFVRGCGALYIVAYDLGELMRAVDEAQR